MKRISLLIVLVTFLFTRRISHTAARLVLLRGKSIEHRYYYTERRLVCVSEDDDSALVWNTNLQWTHKNYEFSDRTGDLQFRSTYPYTMRQPNCNFAPTEECRETWKGSHWTLTSSSSTPMGPVFDVRWEAFKELNNFGRIDEYIPVTQQQKTAVLTFSVRTLADSNVYLCDTKDIKKFCYWVGIGTQDNTVSVIRKCPHGVLPNPPPKSGVCGKIRASLSHKPLSATEWRTFTLFWNHTSGNISLYDTKRLLMTYADTEEREHSQETYHIILRHPRPALYRLHTYQFFRTSNPEGILKSPILFRDISTICFQVLIGLCAKCKMEIVAIDVQKEEISEVLGVADGSRVAAVHGLPMWQRVRIDKAISFDTSNGFGIKFVPRLIGETANPLWAVANFRACYPEGTVRIASMTATTDYANYKYIWRNVTCQKLSYDENTLVNSVQDPRLGMKFVDSECPLDKIGPYCSTSCTSHLEVEANCFGVVICEESGCTCPPGFVGTKCRKKCDIGKYGHDCNGTCGTCYRASCDSRTGHCTNGCDNSKRFNIPPHCKKGIDPPPPPEINFFNETTVIASIPARDEYKEITTEYLFIAKVNESGEIRSGLKNNPILPNTTKLIGRIDGLTPGTVYGIACVLYVGEKHRRIFGEFRNVTKLCAQTRTLEDAPSTVRNMTIKFLAHTEISLTWSPPEILNGVIRRYIIILRVITYYGCAALKRTVPEMDVVTTFSSGTTIIFPHLHPYAYYAAIVSACTSKCGPEQTTYFSIEASATPTAVFSNVKFENNVLSWESTMDCRTITGPIFGARILIDGVSESVKTQHLEKVTALDSITLNAKTLVLLGAESYRARVYVIRGYKEEHNDAAYAETVFRVPPMPPPSVRNLEVYEVDVEGGKTSLRWQAPSPPLHGKLESYTVFKCSASCDIVQTIKPDAACELWENYICATVDLPTQRYNGLSVG
ncbi:hypothetical protein KM043_018827 [Ampulex compressa]|nr:hypothetical protein KM043_018827 [Ampulex compressa]